MNSSDAIQPDPSKRRGATYFQQSNVIDLAEQLVGQLLVTNIDNTLTAGFITETEAYRHSGDRASHAHGDTRTARTETMYAPGGRAYVYLCYGIHHLFNIVTNQKDIPDAVLVRAIEPFWGIEAMQQRRQMNHRKPSLTAGPGRLTEALGITTDYDNINLCSEESPIWIQPHPSQSHVPISTGARIGVDYAGDDAALPWRFGWKGNRYLSQSFP